MRDGDCATSTPLLASFPACHSLTGRGAINHKECEAFNARGKTSKTILKIPIERERFD
jgi:hypothetical protein